MRIFPLKTVGIGAGGYVYKRERTISEKLDFILKTIITLFLVWVILFFLWAPFFSEGYEELDKKCVPELGETSVSGFEMLICQYKVFFHKILLKYNQYVLFTIQLAGPMGPIIRLFL